MLLQEFGSVEEGVVTIATLRGKELTRLFCLSSRYSITSNSRSLPVVVSFGFPFSCPPLVNAA